jgi:hypothetical protein
MPHEENAYEQDRFGMISKVGGIVSNKCRVLMLTLCGERVLSA